MNLFPKFQRYDTIVCIKKDIGLVEVLDIRDCDPRWPEEGPEYLLSFDDGSTGWHTIDYVDGEYELLLDRTVQVFVEPKPGDSVLAGKSNREGVLVAYEPGWNSDRPFAVAVLNEHGNWKVKQYARVELNDEQ